MMIEHDTATTKAQEQVLVQANEHQERKGKSSGR